MDFLKKFLKNDNTVVGLCDLKRRTVLSTFSGQSFGFSQNPATTYIPAIPGGLLYTK